MTGAYLQGERFKNKNSLKNQHDVDAEMFSDISKYAGDKPRGTAAVFAGFTKGLEDASKSKSTAKRQEEADKYDRVMDYLSEVNGAAIERREWYEKREMARQQFLPQVLAYADSIDRLDPQSQRIMAQSILEGYGRSVGEDLKLVSIDGSNPFLVTVGNDKGNHVMDVRSLFAGDDVLQQQLAMKMPQYQEKLQQERLDKQRDYDLKREELDRKYPQGGGDGGNYGSIPLAVMKGKGTTQLINTVNSEMNLSKEAPIILNMLNEAKQIIGEHPVIGSSWANLVGKSDIARGALLSKEDRAAYEKLNKIANRISESYIKAKGSAITESERETIKKGLFDVSLGSEGNQYNINSVEKELKLAKLRGDFAAKELSRGFIATSESFNNYLQENPELSQEGNKPSSGKMYTLRTPDGKLWPNIPEDKLDAAIAAGGQVVE